MLHCKGEFLGYWAVMNSAVFSFAGVESVAMAAAETRNPRQAIPKACKRVFWRVVSGVVDVFVALQWLLCAVSFDRSRAPNIASIGSKLILIL